MASKSSHSSQKLSVVMVSGQYMPETFGGAQQQCGKLSGALSALGCLVTVFTNRASYKLPAMEVVGEVEIVRPYTAVAPQTMGRYIAASFVWIMQWLWWLMWRKPNPDILHAHQAKLQAYLACLGGRLLGIPVVVKVGNAGDHDDLARMKRKFLLGNHVYRAIVRDTDAFVAISSDIADELRRHGVRAERIHRIPNGVLQSIPRAELRLRRTTARMSFSAEIAPEEKLLVYAGRLEAVKNLGLLIEAFARWQAVSGSPRARLWLIGEGEERAALEAVTSRLKVSEQVAFRGYAANVDDYLLAADFLVMSSVAEGMSNSLLEAMAAGTVPISTPVSGAKDLITHGVNGILARDVTVDGYLEALQTGGALTAADMADYSLRCYDLISQGYVMERIAEKHIQLYRQLQGARRIKRT